MSKDIRSFFKALPRHEKNKVPPKESKKGTVEIRDSDDEDVIKCTPEQKTKPHKRCAILSSDSEDETTKSTVDNYKATKKEKLKPINIDDVFNDTPVKQSKVDRVAKLPTNQKDTDKHGKKSKKSKKTELGIHDDKNFERTLLDSDGDALLENIDFDATINEELSKNKSEETVGSSTENSTTKSEVCKMKIDERKRARKSSDETPSKKPKIDLDSSIDPDQDKYEKKRYSAMLYQKYKNRGGPKHHGEKEILKGKPDCLQGLTFLRTGVLDSLESEEFENLIAEHGGRVVHGVSKKVNYLVVGEDPGPAKLAKAEQYHIPQISEDDLLDMILVKSGMKPKFKKNDSGDTGFASGSEEFSCNNNTETAKNSEQTQKTKISPKKVEKKKLKTSPSKAEKLLKDAPEKSEVGDKRNLKSTLECDDHKTKNSAALTETTCTESNTFTANSNTCFTWTDKYKPVSMKNIIGQQDPNSNMNKLKKWLANWHKNQNPEVRKKLPVPTPWKQNDGAYYKCALLSGPPGVGKTTTATIVAKELGFDVVEFNASDTRNKKSLQQEVSQLLTTNTIVGFTEGKSKTDNKRVLIMDEVDGMAGNEDRGGIQELIALIKKTKVPIICICNDRNIQKMRSLVQYCYDLKFTRPSTQQIMGALMSICFKEGLNIKPDALSELINGTGGDIRQALTHLSMWSAVDKCLPLETVKKDAQEARKDVVLGLWDVIRKVFSEADHKNMSISDKSRLFFFDYSMGPLFVQENYIYAVPNVKSEHEKLKRLAKSADSLSIGDLIETKIRSSNNWALLETQAFFSSVFPGYYMSGTLRSINFPSWLGKNSKKNKLNRMISELHVHTRTCTTGNLVSMRMDYLKPLRDAIINPLRQKGMNGISEAVEVMKSYNLLREDLNNIVELCEWAHTKNPFNSIDSKVKAAFTRLYNKECPLLPFAPATVSKKRAPLPEDDVLEEDEGVVQSDEEADDVSSDALIKVKKRKDATKKESAKNSTKATSKEKGTGKGRTSKTRK